jgi:CRISPR-associated protein Csb2
VPQKLRPDEVAVIINLRELSGKRSKPAGGAAYEVKGFPRVRLLFQAAGTIEQVAPELCKPARSWRSLTPYLPVRHPKRKPLDEFLTADINTEFGYRDRHRDLPPAVVTPVEAEGGVPDRWAREFRRYRLTERMDRSRPGLALRLKFAEEVAGPVLLGQLSHFGYGIFRPDEP